jgi:hypothetical protein
MEVSKTLEGKMDVPRIRHEAPYKPTNKNNCKPKIPPPLKEE